MGVYVAAIAEHSFDTLGSYDPTELFEPSVEVISAHIDVWRKWWRKPVRWPVQLRPDPAIEWVGTRRTADSGMSILDFDGPYGLYIEIGPRFCEIRPTPKWGAFVSDPAVEAAITALCQVIATCIGARRLLYLPDSAYCSSQALDFLEYDLPLDAVVDWLAVDCGPPAPSISSIYRPLSDDEMSKHIPDWDGQSEYRMHKADGYFVASVG